MEARQGVPVRVVRLEIADQAAGEQLCGPGVQLHGPVEVVFVHMLPCPPNATLAGVLAHGLALTFADDGQPGGLVVPWGQIAYLRLLPRADDEQGRGDGE